MRAENPPPLESVKTVRRITTCWLAVALLGGAGEGLAGQHGNKEPGLLHGRIVRIGTSGQTAWLRPTDDGPTRAPTLNDRVLLHRSGKLIATGNVIALSQGNIGIRVTWQDDPILERDIGILIDSSCAHHYREHSPRTAGIYSTLEHLGPGSVNGWLSAGSFDGLRVGDLLLVLRKSLPIAQARISVIDAHRSAVELTPLTANVIAKAGDPASLWPTPWNARAGLVRTTVLAVTQQGPDPVVTLAGGNAVRFRTGQSFEFHRAGRFIGLGEAIRVDDRLCQVRFAESLSREPPRVGDVAIRRAEKIFGHQATPGRIFRIEGEYCLVNVGEREGVRRGQDLLVVRSGTPLARLAVRTVKVDYSGADIVEVLVPGEKIARWDDIHPAPFGEIKEERTATVRQVASEGWAAGCAHGANRLPGLLGEVVQLRSPAVDASTKNTVANGSIGAGVVVAEGESGVVLYSPQSWRHDALKPGMYAISKK